MHTLVTEMYGGKIDDESDFSQLQQLVESVFTVDAFEAHHRLVKEAVDGGLKVPEGTEMTDFVRWVDDLPEREPPTFLGLPANAEKLLLVGQGQRTIENVRRLAQILEESEQLEAAADSAD